MNHSFTARMRQLEAQMNADSVTAGLLEAANIRLARTNYDAYLASDYWQIIRAEVLDRVHFCCDGCGLDVNELRQVRGDHLEVHHKTYQRLGAEWRNLADLEALCGRCHSFEHGHSSHNGGFVGFGRAAIGMFMELENRVLEGESA